MENGLNLLAESAHGRAAFYEYLSIVFKMPPDETFIGVTGKILPHMEAYAAETDNKKMLEGVKDLKEYINIEENADQMMLLDMLNSQYTTLFLLGDASIPACESVYLSPDRMVKQKPWEKVMESYHIRAFKLPANFKESEDHIAAELMFMEEMCLLVKTLAAQTPAPTEDAIEAVFREQYAFLNEHLMKWAVDFASVVAASPAASDIVLYRGCAKVMAGYLEEETAFIKELQD